VAQVVAEKIRLPAPASMHQHIREQKRTATWRGAHPLRVQLLDYMDALAKQLGVAPKLLRHPRLIVPLLAGPLVAAQYRLDGPGQWEHAGAHIRKVAAPGRAPSGR